MELRQLEYVVAVADCGGFTAGAAAVHVAQPSLSQSVRTLELELRVELFHRVGRGVTLSAAGEAFVASARQVLRDVAGLRASVAAVGDVVSGRLDLAALPTLAVDPGAPLVGAFRQLHPGVIVRLLDPGDPGGVARLVRQGRAELGLADLPVGADDLAVVPLGHQELLAVGPPRPPGEPEARQRRGRVWSSVSLLELTQSPVVATSVGTSTRRVLDEALAAAGVEPTIAVEVDQREAVVPLVLAGAGISFVPAAQAVAAGLLGATVMRPDPPLARAIGLVHRDRPLSPAAQSFRTLAVERLGQPKRPVT
jgi:LysR family transcriptional regulator, carnitine catabolism transcriptional activator